MATERMKKAAKLIAGGMDVADAMQEAGYGLGCIPGLAPVCPDILDVAGLTSKPTTASRSKPDGGKVRGSTATTTDSDDSDGAKTPATKTPDPDSGKGAKSPAAKEALPMTALAADRTDLKVREGTIRGHKVAAQIRMFNFETDKGRKIKRMGNLITCPIDLFQTWYEAQDPDHGPVGGEDAGGAGRAVLPVGALHGDREPRGDGRRQLAAAPRGFDPEALHPHRQRVAPAGGDALDDQPRVGGSSH